MAAIWDSFMRQAAAPAFSSACLGFFAPGMTTTLGSLSNQAREAWARVPHSGSDMSLRAPRNGATWRRPRLENFLLNLLMPPGLFPTWYLPVRSPMAMGL